MTLCQKQRTNSFFTLFWKVYHYVLDLKSRQGFVFLGEQTHQSQSDEGGDGIETRVCIHRTRANHKGRDAPAAPPLLLDRAGAQRSSPLVGDRWVAENCFTKQKVCTYLNKSTAINSNLNLASVLFSLKNGDSAPQLET